MFKRKIIDKLITELDVGSRISILPGLFPAEFRCVWSQQDAVSRPSIVEKMSQRVGQRR